LPWFTESSLLRLKVYLSQIGVIQKAYNGG
jgi:hypothetical protein